VKDERSLLVVCSYCGARLELTALEAKVLAPPQPGGCDYPLAVGDSFRWGGVRYEVLGRMTFIEDGDPSAATREFLLYHPRRGSLYLDEYHGEWSLSRATHLAPVQDPFAVRPGDVLGTHDGRQWVADEPGTYSLAHVDGCWPWRAQVGDQLPYAEFAAQDGSGAIYDVQNDAGEIEYCLGQVLPLAQVRSATAKPELAGAKRMKLDAAGIRRWFRLLLGLSLLAAMVNVGLMAWTCGTGKQIHEETFLPENLRTEVLSQPFTVTESGTGLEVQLDVPSLDNSWAALDVALVNSDDGVVGVTDQDVEYYQGVEGGESWSEGGRSASAYLEVEEPGTYRLLLRERSGYGESSSSDTAEHSVHVRVKQGVLIWWWFAGAGCLSLVLALGTGYFWYRWWKGDDGDDDDDDDDD
jgi:hypothetical protein